MRKSILSAVALVALIIAVPLAHAASAKTFHAKLSGKSEAPTKGDADGKGTATVKVKGRQVCWTLTWSKIGSPVMAHIHKGAKGQAGAVVVPLFTAAPGKHSGCKTVTSSLAKDIVKHYEDYYVNIHTTAFPGGAIRGQLSDDD
jgi:hypothetical protein